MFSINFPRPYGRGFHGLNFVALHLEGKRKMQGELHPSTLRACLKNTNKGFIVERN
jgi:hypothetical protein